MCGDRDVRDYAGIGVFADVRESNDLRKFNLKCNRTRMTRIRRICTDFIRVSGNLVSVGMLSTEFVNLAFLGSYH